MSENTPPGGDHQVRLEHPVPALNYDAFRRMADWAAGIAREKVTFHYSPDGTLSAETAPRSDGGELKVDARTREKRSRVESLVLGTGAGSVKLAPLSDAVFWSEAAVEKFLLPYYASLGAGRAAAVMAQVMGAWTAGPEVVALTHHAHPSDRAGTGITDGLGVVRQSGDGVEHLSLTSFLAEHLPALLGPSIPVPNPAPSPPHLMELPAGPGGDLHLPDYLELRVMAEWASSLRGTGGYFVYDTSHRPDDRHPYAAIEHSATVPADRRGKLVIPVRTDPLVDGRTRATSVKIQARSSGTLELAEVADAVFWSTGAVEHLLMPYYAQVYGGQAYRQIDRIHAAWWKNRPREEGEAGTGTEVYALLHLPNSDWTTRARGVLDLTGVLYSAPGAGEELRMEPLGDFLETHPD